jgi:hypothetical protein
VVTEVKKHSSLFIKYKAEYNFEKNASVYVFELIPTLNPSGNLSLMSVQNGKSENLQDLRFQEMKKTGTLAIRVTKTGIDLGYDLDCTTISFSKQQVTIPKNAEYLGRGHSSSENSDGVVWYIAFFTGDQPSEWTTGSELDTFLENSEKNPTMISYIVSIKMDKTPNKENSTDGVPPQI